MSGIIALPSGRFLFRSHDDMFLAWDIHSDPSRGSVHKWSKLPRHGQVEVLFDIDNPPPSIAFLPILSHSV